MCIILVKESGIELPSKEILHNCWNNNSDGAGFMYARNNTVHINKGYMKWKQFYRSYRMCKFTKDDALVIHFRIATSGYVDSGNTHPFPITDNADTLRALQVECNHGMAHNGIFALTDNDKRLSDTQAFIRKIVSQIKIEKLFTSKAMQDLLEKYISGSRLAFMNSKGRILTLGNTWETKDGIRYSNSGYESYNWRKYQWNGCYGEYYGNPYTTTATGSTAVKSKPRKFTPCPICKSTMVQIHGTNETYEYCPDCEISYYDGKGTQVTVYNDSETKQKLAKDTLKASSKYVSKYYSCPMCDFGKVDAFQDVVQHMVKMHNYTEQDAIMDVLEEDIIDGPEHEEILYCELCHTNIVDKKTGYIDSNGFAVCEECLKE